LRQAEVESDRGREGRCGLLAKAGAKSGDRGWERERERQAVVILNNSASNKQSYTAHLNIIIINFY
jgi:hypothetical protein